MIKRIGAIVLLIGFVALLVNLLFFQVFLAQSITLYAIIALFFLVFRTWGRRE